MRKRIHVILEERLVREGKVLAAKDDRSFSAYLGQLIKKDTAPPPEETEIEK
jgi:hypothetical protein